MPLADEPQGEVWDTPGMVHWGRLLLDSYAQWTGRELLDRLGSPEAQARTLFAAPFVVASHGTEDDPMLNYGNRMALELWEMTWAQFTRTPSRLTADPVNGPSASACWSMRGLGAGSTTIEGSGSRVQADTSWWRTQLCGTWSTLRAERTAKRRLSAAGPFSHCTTDALERRIAELAARGSIVNRDWLC